MSATFKLFLPSGVECSIPVKDFLEQDPANIFATITLLSQKAMLAGFLATNVQTTLGQGENKEEIGFAVRVTTSGGQRGPCPALHLYSTKAHYTKAFIVAYINSGDDLIAFEQVSGLRLEEMPEFVGQGRIERGKNPKADQLVMKFAQPAVAIWGPNPKYNEAHAAAATKDDPYTVAKKKFLRWDGVTVTSQSPNKTYNAPVPTTAPQTTTQPPVKEMGRDEFNDLLDGLRNAKTSRKPMEALKAANDKGNNEAKAGRLNKLQQGIFETLKDRCKKEIEDGARQLAGTGQWKQGEPF